LHDVLHACDVVFGATTVLLAVVGTWLLATGQTHVMMVLALWAIPVFNVAWSAITKHRSRVVFDSIRGAICVPITTYIYVADTSGILHQLWIPAVVCTIGAGLTFGIATRRAVPGTISAFIYSGALLLATRLIGGALDSSVFDDALGIVLTGSIVSLVASRLGRTLDEVRRQHDDAQEQRARAEQTLEQLTERTSELTVAIVNLNAEMEHRARVEVELHQAQKLESVGRLAAGIAHEINTPVQFVGDSIEFVRTAVGDLFELVHKLEIVQHSISQGMPLATAASEAAQASEEADLPYLTMQVPKALDLAAEGLGRVATIVRSMKEFAHPDSKTMVAADLNRAVASTLTMANNEVKYVGDLVTELGDLPPVHCYVGELNQVVLNIVVNAAHAIGELVAGTERRGTITVRTYREGDDAVISIADTGGGIPETIRGHVFDPFFTTKDVGRGTGQGLAIARSVVVDKHRGTLTFETETGRGTTFFIRVPIAGTTLALAA
jgi:signal transduction histidine kinase